MHTNSHLLTENTTYSLEFITRAGAHPGYRRSANPKGVCRPIIWPMFLENCMEMKIIGQTWEGVRPKFYYVDPPLFRDNTATLLLVSRKWRNVTRRRCSERVLYTG